MNQLIKTRYLVLILVGIIVSIHISPTTVSAQTSTNLTLESVDIELIMDTNGTTHLLLESQVHNTGSIAVSEMSYHIDSLDANLVCASVDQQEVIGSVSVENRYTVLTIPFPENLNINESVKVCFEIEVNDLQSNIRLTEDSAYYNGDILYYIRPINEMHNITLSIVLPQHTSLSIESVVPIYPEPNYNSTDGFSLRFTWETPILRPGQEKVFIVSFRFPNVAPVQPVVVSTLQLLSVIIGIVIGIVSTLVGPRVYERLKRVGDVRIVGVTNEEEEVLDIIRDKGGSCPQKELYTEMNLSQSKVSIILTNLEERGLIKRFRDGRENRVHLLEE